MRSLAAAALALVLAVAARAEPVEFVRVWPGWRGDEYFVRIAEFFGGGSEKPDSHVLRTRPDKRAGYYFLVRVKHPDTALAGAKFQLHLILPESPEPKLYEFPAQAGPGTDVFELGLTGSDWPGRGEHPVAWRLDLVSSAGAALASAQSFLWSKP